MQGWLDILPEQTIVVPTLEFMLYQSVWYKIKIYIQDFGHQHCWAFVRELPKIVTSINSQFQHVVDTVRAASSLAEWIPIKVARTSKINKIWVVYRLLELAPSDCYHVEHIVPSGILQYILWCGPLQQTRCRSDRKTCWPSTFLASCSPWAST